MLVPIWQSSAIADLIALVNYIATHNPVAAKTLREEIIARADRLPEAPRVGRIGRMAGTRELVVRPTYIVVYAEAAGAVTILRVLHTARRWP